MKKRDVESIYKDLSNAYNDTKTLNLFEKALQLDAVSEGSLSLIKRILLEGMEEE